MDSLDSKAPVAIVVDSAASLPAGSSEYQHLYVAPMGLALNGKSYLDGVDLAPTEFYRLLRESSTLPTTSAPSPARFLEAFQRASEYADSVLCITVASRFSASRDSATDAAREAMKEKPNLRIEVLDSESAAGGEGLIALEAWRAAKNGADLERALKRAKAISEKVRLLAFVDTLYYLWKGGRVLSSPPLCRPPLRHRLPDFLRHFRRLLNMQIPCYVLRWLRGLARPRIRRERQLRHYRMYALRYWTARARQVAKA